MPTGVVGSSSSTGISPAGPPVTDEVVSSSSSLAPATVPVPPPPSDSFVGGDFLFEDILNLKAKRKKGLGQFNCCTLVRNCNSYHCYLYEDESVIIHNVFMKFIQALIDIFPYYSSTQLFCFTTCLAHRYIVFVIP